MVKSAALMAAILSAVPASAFAQAPCGGPREMTVCEAELYEAGVIWEGRAKEERSKLKGCIEKLKVRTSTAINSIVIPAPPPQLPSGADNFTVYVSIGALGLGVGLILGLLLK